MMDWERRWPAWEKMLNLVEVVDWSRDPRYYVGFAVDSCAIRLIVRIIDIIVQINI